MGNNIKIKEQRTYIEDDYQLAYTKARRELGPNLVILEKKEIKIGGILGMFTKKKVKVTYGVEEIKEVKKESSNDANKEILDLLKKMGYEKNGQKSKNIIQEEDINVVNEENTGVYTPYKLNNLKNNTPKQNIKNNRSEEDIESIKMKIKEEIKAEMKAEIKKEILSEKIKKEKNNEEIKNKDLFWENLKKNDIEEDIINDIKAFFESKQYKEDDDLYEGLREYFIKNIEVKTDILESKIIMLVGPTGVGKTTSCAKIIANKWKDEKDVAFITADTYRLEAVSQLKAYANIMKVPVEVVSKAEELAGALEKFKQKDFVIMDTAGRSPKNKEQMEELKSYLEEIGKKIDVCLVVSATSKLSVLYETLEKFKYIGFSSIIFTKLDETTGIGALLSLYKKYSIPVSYITNGQRVPDDIELATKETLSQIFVEGLKYGSGK